MQEALEFEREKASKMMRGARAACARRISDLRQENDTLKRRLSKRETELASMVKMSRGSNQQRRTLDLFVGVVTPDINIYTTGGKTIFTDTVLTSDLYI